MLLMTWWVVCPPGEGQRETGAWEKCVVCSVECWSVECLRGQHIHYPAQTTPGGGKVVMSDIDIMDHDSHVIRHCHHIPWQSCHQTLISWRSWRSCHQTLTSSHLHCDSHVIKHWHWCIIYSGNFISRFRVDKDTLDISIRSSIYIMETIYQVLV